MQRAVHPAFCGPGQGSEPRPALPGALRPRRPPWLHPSRAPADPAPQPPPPRAGEPRGPGSASAPRPFPPHARPARPPGPGPAATPRPGPAQRAPHPAAPHGTGSGERPGGAGPSAPARPLTSWGTRTATGRRRSSRSPPSWLCPIQAGAGQDGKREDRRGRRSRRAARGVGGAWAGRGRGPRGRSLTSEARGVPRVTPGLDS